MTTPANAQFFNMTLIGLSFTKLNKALFHFTNTATVTSYKSNACSVCVIYVQIGNHGQHKDMLMKQTKHMLLLCDATTNKSLVQKMPHFAYIHY